MTPTFAEQLAQDPAGLRARVDALYRQHEADARVAQALGVSVSTLKRGVGKLTAAGFPLTVERKRGRRWSPDPKARKARRPYRRRAGSENANVS